MNSEKDRFYDHLPVRFIEMVEEFSRQEDVPITVTEQEMTQANMLFNQVFAFYGGYCQLSTNAKDQVGEAVVLKQLVQEIADLKEQVRQRDESLKAASFFIDQETTKQEAGYRKLNMLQDQIEKLTVINQTMTKRHTEVKKKLHKDFLLELAVKEKKFQRYRGLAMAELNVKDIII